VGSALLRIGGEQGKLVVERAARDPLTLKDLVVHGEDLITAGVRPGPDIGDMLQRLLADVLEDPRRNTRDHLLARVREWLKAA